jgi:hypothetical protein
MTSKAIRSAGLWCLPLVLLALVSALSSSPARAADPQPVLVYQNPAEGQVLQQAAFGIQLCFASPVNIKDLLTRAVISRSPSRSRTGWASATGTSSSLTATGSRSILVTPSGIQRASGSFTSG